MSGNKGRPWLMAVCHKNYSSYGCMHICIYWYASLWNPGRFHKACEHSFLFYWAFIQYVCGILSPRMCDSPANIRMEHDFFCLCETLLVEVDINWSFGSVTRDKSRTWQWWFQYQLSYGLTVWSLANLVTSLFLLSPPWLHDLNHK